MISPNGSVDQNNAPVADEVFNTAPTTDKSHQKKRSHQLHRSSAALPLHCILGNNYRLANYHPADQGSSDGLSQSSQRASKPPEDMLPRKEEVEDTVIKAHATFSATVLMVVVVAVVVVVEGGMMMEKLGPAMGWESGISGVERTASARARRGVCQLPGHTTGSGAH
ncbi:unnamed protein product [Arctogadus glacialis]